ncbi:MAG: response regulator [Dehalococcoidia bacterium]
MSTELGARPVEILLVEDSADDVELTMEGFKEGKVLHHLSVAVDGVEALEFLRKQGKYANVAVPDIILLDLNLPRKDGRQVLEEIKVDPDLRHIPVVVLTTSQADQDILKSYELHANCYITKPVDLEQFFKIIKSLEDFWLTVVKLPSGLHHGT